MLLLQMFMVLGKLRGINTRYRRQLASLRTKYSSERKVQKIRVPRTNPTTPALDVSPHAKSAVS